MKFNKIFIVSLLILAILTIGAVSASDNVTSDDLSVDADDVEEVSAVEISDDDGDENLAAVEEDGDNEDVIGIPEKCDDIVAEEQSAVDESVLTAQNSNKDIVSSDGEKTFKITFLKQTGKYVSDKKLYFKVTDKATGKAIGNAVIWCYIYDSKDTSEGSYLTFWTAKANSNGVGALKIDDGVTVGAGTFIFKAYVFDWNYNKYGTNVICPEYTSGKVKVVKERLKIKANKLTVLYKSKKKFKVKILDSKKKPVQYIAVKVKIYTGSKYKTYSAETNWKGIASFKVSNLKAGKHKVKISIVRNLYTIENGYYTKAATSYIKVQKPVSIKTKSYALGGKYGLGGVIDVYVKDKVTKKLTNGIKVTLKIYSGKKFRTVKLVTGKDLGTKKKGYVGYATNELSVGKHKVKIIIDTPKYKGSKTASLTIPKISKYYPKWHAKATKGKEYYSKGFYKMLGY